MKVILLTHVKKLGAQGDIVDVSSGYAQNFLFTQNLAAPATAAALAQANARIHKQDREDKRKKQAARQVVGAMDGKTITLSAKASESGTLYAAVTAQSIADALNAQGYEVDVSMVQLSEPIKTATTKHVQLKLPHGFQATITVHIDTH